MVSSNNKLFLGVWWGDPTVYARLDVLNIKEGTEQKLKLDIEDLKEIRKIIQEETEIAIHNSNKEFAKVIDSFIFYQRWIEDNIATGNVWYRGLPEDWWHQAGDEEEKFFYEHYFEHVYGSEVWLQKKTLESKPYS